MNHGLHLCGPDLISGNNKKEENEVNESNAVSYLIGLLIFGFIIPLLAMSICCYLIPHYLRNFRITGQTLGLGPSIIIVRQKQETKQCILGAILLSLIHI